MSKWLLNVPQLIETPDELTEEQLVAQLIEQKVIRPADYYTLTAICENCDPPKI